MRRCWVNFQCRGVLLIWIIVGQGPIALAVGAGGGCLDIFSLIYHFSFLSPSLWETARYRLKYCLKGPLSPKQPTNILSTILPDVRFKHRPDFLFDISGCSRIPKSRYNESELYYRIFCFVVVVFIYFILEGYMCLARVFHSNHLLLKLI